MPLFLDSLAAAHRKLARTETGRYRAEVGPQSLDAATVAIAMAVPRAITSSWAGL